MPMQSSGWISGSLMAMASQFPRFSGWETFNDKASNRSMGDTPA
jgi:hypothetical protein